MRIYILWEMEYDDAIIHGAYSSLEKLKESCFYKSAVERGEANGLEISAYELDSDEGIIEPPLITTYHCGVNWDTGSAEFANSVKERIWFYEDHAHGNRCYGAMGHSAQSKAKALELALSRRMKYK